MLPSTLTKFHIDETPVGVLAQEYVDRVWALVPSLATYTGIEGYDHILDDYSYDNDAVEKLNLEFLDRLATTELHSDAERLAAEVFEHDLRVELEDGENGFGFRCWGTINSPAAELRELIDIMATDTAEQKAAIVARVEQIPRALEQWRDTLLAAREDGHVNSRHATLETIKQFAAIADKGAWEATVTDLGDGFDPAIGAAADAAHRATAAFLEQVYLPLTRDALGVGQDAYEFLAYSYTGTRIDLRAAYQAACEEIISIHEQMQELGRSIYPDAASITEVTERLDNDPAYKVGSRDELLATIRGLVDHATEALSDQFHIPDEIRFCDIKLDDEAMDATPYYQGPTEDLSRPGAMCYPTLGATEFSIWRQVSTIYHEGVPGHHLQVATATIQREALTSFQRVLSWNAGYGEGWALYSERLMDELGYFGDPAYRLGHLIDRAMRVARVVVDIGIHCDLEAPDGGRWDYDRAVEFFVTYTLLPRDYVVSEINRYIAWAGQAISYKVGETKWLAARAAAMDAGISMPQFHREMLETGSLPLDVFDRYVGRMIERHQR